MLWDYLTHVINNWKGEVIIMGDFNEVRCKSERFGSNFNVQGANVFNSFIVNAGLKEIPLGGCSFTWCHKSATKMSKLDRFLISENLMITCPNFTATSLERYLSDHRPILLRVNKLLNAWIEAPVDESNAMINMMKNLKYLKQKIRDWNKGPDSQENVLVKWKNVLASKRKWPGVFKFVCFEERVLFQLVWRFFHLRILEMLFRHRQVLRVALKTNLFLRDSAGFNTGVIMDAKILPSIGEASGNLPDVSELDASVFLEDVEANSMNVLDMGCSPSMQQHVLEVGRVHDIQQNVCDVARPVRKCKTVCSQVSVEEFEGGRVYRGVGISNPGGNVNVENLRTNVNRSAGPSNLVLNVMPNPGYGSTSTSPYVSWLEEHYHMLVTNNTELYNRVEKLSSAKAAVECQVNEFKGKLLTCELDVARQKKEVERFVREKEVRDRLVSLDQEVIYIRKDCDR
ncbi:RNA-directed DNA polymerase, eukaryota [Tanacetum coccineum]